MILVNAATLHSAEINGHLVPIMLPSAVSELLDREPLVLEVREASAELFFLVNDQMVRRPGHEAVARAAQQLFASVRQPVVIESAVGAPVSSFGSASDCSAWGLRVVVVLDESGAPLWSD